eukprot:Protomagalhaensia_wolfi_Nauph_80__2822@NODE_2931_length_939_cov_213_167778_g2301_i0_p1_GENE_NODE_2931_length_939_cov_213_167778_g2301_i0NODE_2931_length_939_cov_213_167778_g2301_i0_p1_ORF_typecomplete_len255_score21_62Got1/PF04178_12/8_5e26PDR_CDR/PF06422_12/0_083_NODE_2931_length_939_cov_213_167778_g2301_i0141905
MASAQTGFGATGAPPAFQLYSASGGPAPADPYQFQHPQTVNLSGKIAPAAEPSAPAKATAASSLLNSVTSVVETGYQSARNVVFSNQSSSPDAGSASGSFSLFSLSYQQMINFAICIGLGILFFFLAFLFLPMVVFAPQKFVLLFTMGSMCWITGLAMLQGPKTLFAALIRKEKIYFTLIYAGSVAATFYATLIAHSYLLTLLFCGVQMVSLVAFLISYFPGGPRMLGMVKDLVVDKVRGVLGLSPSGGSILPL